MPRTRSESRNNNSRNNETITWERNFSRRSGDSDSSTSGYRDRIMNSAEKIQRTTMISYHRAHDSYRSLSLLQRALLFLAGAFGVGALVLFLRFGESVFAWIAPLAERWRGVNGGWILLWALTFVVGMPPMIGYTSCVTVAGFVYGVWKGWAIAASATILGSTVAFLLSRHFYSSFVNRLVAHDRRFAALSLTLKHDGIKLLVMIRLCPLPYSLSNGALSTFHTVNWQSFMAATAIATPKLFIPVFIGSRLAAIADNMEDLDAGAKFVNWMGIIISFGIGITTAWFIYRQTKMRAEQLEAQERSSATSLHTTEHDGDESDFEDDEFENEDIDDPRYVDDSDASLPLHKTRKNEGEYRDESSSDDLK